MAKKHSVKVPKVENRYGAILSHVFSRYYRPGLSKIDFAREDLDAAAESLKLVRLKNLGDLVYTFRFRQPMPVAISQTASQGLEWVIELAGVAKYRMRQRKINRILPRENTVRIEIPDATPEIVVLNALSDEQALLAKIRYNRLIDVFLKVAAYSLQNHLRTTTIEMGQIETDEIYVAVTNTGQQFVVPVQAKGKKDQIGAVQVEQDLAMCRAKYPTLVPRPVAVQFAKDERGNEVIVMFELQEVDGEIRVKDEKHYQLVRTSKMGTVVKEE